MKPTIVFLMGNSGSGKSFLEKNFLKDYSKYFHKVISHTTRPIDKIDRKETDGVDYHFVSKQKFLDMKDNLEFVQITKYGENFYGSTFSEYDKNIPFVMVSIVPKEAEKLKNRLMKRGFQNFRSILLDISDQKILNNLKNSGLSDSELEKIKKQRLSRANLVDEFNETNLDIFFHVKDDDQDLNLHHKIFQKLTNT